MKPVTKSMWWLAIRPKTLPAALAPVIVGTAMAVGDGIHHWPSAGVALAAALLIQVATNLANDYFDYCNGADTQERTGPVRVTQAGLIPPRRVLLAAVLAFALFGLASAYLIMRGGWPIALLAVLAILSGIFYTAGPYPLGYLGLGEVFVIIFFGPVAVGGTYYVQSYEIHGAAIWAGIACGLLSAAILAVNNLRDIPTDRKSGKRTLAVRFGRRFAIWEYYLCIIGAGLTPVLIYGIIHDHLEILWATLIIPAAFPGIRCVCNRTDGIALNRTLAFTGKLLLLFSILFSLGWIGWPL